MSFGTGFFVALGEMVIVTNKHVIKDSLGFEITLSIADGTETPTHKCDVYCNVAAEHWVMHENPEVDLCCFPMSGVLSAIACQDVMPFIVPIPECGIEGDDKMIEYGQMDDVTMIGYPDAIFDEVNNQPIFRRGIIATNPNQDYKGKREFLIDMPVYGGSSGSPIFVVREGTFVNRRTGQTMVAHTPNCHLIGIVYATYQHLVDGRIKIVPVPTTAQLVPSVSVPNNLGLVIRAERILELKEALRKSAGMECSRFKVSIKKA